MIPFSIEESPFESFDGLMTWLRKLGPLSVDCRLIGPRSGGSLYELWLFAHGKGVQMTKLLWYRRGPWE